MADITPDRYRSESKQRLLKVLVHLGGNEVNGLAPSQISKALGIEPSSVTSDLANLYLAGLAEQIPETGRWRLSPVLPQIGVAMLATVDRAERRVAEVRQRFTRT